MQTIARILERMGDHATRLAHLEKKTVKSLKLSGNAAISNSIMVETVENIVHNMYTKDVNIIHNAKLDLVELRNTIEGEEDDLWTGRGSAERLLCEFRISESIRRLCAYSVNFAEILLNMLMHKQLETI